MPSNFRTQPYGTYICDDSLVYFDRDYRPIVRLAQPEWSIAVCDPHERIAHTGKEWLYRDATSPRRNAQTRERLENLLAAIPELATEVRRRNATKVSA
jgi:hypothetical protein